MASTKPKRVKARLPRGFADREATDLRAEAAMLATIRRVYESYGFEPVETPLFEYTDALGKFLPDSDRPNEGVFSLVDDDEQWMSLRYDLTAPLARYVAENFETLPKPYRSYRVGTVFRNEKPGPGRFRQFTQFDADIVGAPNVSADAEMAMMMADTMEALGIPRGQYVIRVNNRKVLDGVLEAIGLGGEENAGKRLTVLRAIDKLDKFGSEGVRALLGPGRRDESGDFTKGAGLRDDQIGVIEDVISPDFRISFYGKSGASYPSPKSLQLGGFDIHSESFMQAIMSLRALSDFFSEAGYGQDRIRIDPSVVRGLEYYTGPVFEAELLFPVVNERGEKVVFGSVGGGGRYDGLVSRFLSTPVPATGFSIGVSRLQTALKNLGRLKGEAATGPVVVTVMDPSRLANYQAMASALRRALNTDANGRPVDPPVPVELFQGNPKGFGRQLQYADRRGAPVAIIQGPDEAAAGTVQVKDLAAGKALSEAIADNAEWREARAGQEFVTIRTPEGGEDFAPLIEAVRRILAGRR